MKRVALIGESPNDTYAIKHLLMQKYNEGFHFFPLLNNIRGSKLDSPKAQEAFVREVRLNNPDYVIVIRDSDGFENSSNASKRRLWYKNLSDQINKTSLFLLNIHALEALILADISTFNKHYNTNIRYRKDVTLQENPKKYLKDQTSKSRKHYDESHCEQLFQLMSIHTIETNCDYFRHFIRDFEGIVGN